MAQPTAAGSVQHMYLAVMLVVEPRRQLDVKHRNQTPVSRVHDLAHSKSSATNGGKHSETADSCGALHRAACV
jgi:hypothetical protein